MKTRTDPPHLLRRLGDLALRENGEPYARLPKDRAEKALRLVVVYLLPALLKACRANRTRNGS